MPSYNFSILGNSSTRSPSSAIQVRSTMCPFCQSIRSFWTGHSSFFAAPHCVWILRCNNPLTSAYLLWTGLHSSHAPATRFLSLLLFMHESLFFFLLTNVRASQKRLHLLSSITHSISSTNYQYIPTLRHNPLASLVDDSHLTPHTPTFQLHLCLCPISICFKRS